MTTTNNEPTIKELARMELSWDPFEPAKVFMQTEMKQSVFKQSHGTILEQAEISILSEPSILHKEIAISISPL